MRTVCQHLNETFGSDDSDPNGADASAVAAGATAAAAAQLNSDPESDSQAAATSGATAAPAPPLLRALREANSPKLECKVENLLREHGHRWIWTPPYCPWLQPVRTHLSCLSDRT